MDDNIEFLWNQYNQRLLAFICSRVEDDAEAEDILQETFVRVHRNLCCKAEWEKPESWFYQIARNLIIDHYRRRREMVELPESLPAEPDLPEEEDAETVLALSLTDMVNELPEPYRQALLLTEYQGLNQKGWRYTLVFHYRGQNRACNAREKNCVRCF